ncbi:MAG: ABC transporter permease [Limisphaerales bacterium]
MNRQLALLRFALGSSRQRAGRTVALILALALVTFAFSAVLFLTEALRREYRLGTTLLPELIVQRLVAGRPALIAGDQAAAIASLPGVISVRPRVWGYYFVPALAGNFTVVGTDPEAKTEAFDPALAIGKGRLHRPGAPGEIVVGEALAAFLGLAVDDVIGLPAGPINKRLEVVGLFRSTVALWIADVLLMSVADAREFLQVPADHATDLAVRLSTADEAVVVAGKIADLIPGARVLDRQLMVRTYDLTFDTRGGMMGAMLIPALVAFLVMAWDRLTGVGPGERREIGVLKAIGWKTSDVLAARLWESTVIGSQQRLSVTNVLFVMGSDLTGPMGKALVPIAGRTPAEQFMKDHRGTRVLTVAEITPDLLREIAGKPALPTPPAP